MFQETIRAEYDRVKRYGNHVSLVMLDIDHFRNSTIPTGIQSGTKSLRWSLARSRQWSGPPTAPFATGAKNSPWSFRKLPLKMGALLAERIRRHIEADRSVKGLVITVSIGVGGVMFPKRRRHASSGLTGRFIAQRKQAGTGWLCDSKNPLSVGRVVCYGLSHSRRGGGQK